MVSEFSLSVAESLYQSEEEFPVDLDFAWEWLGYYKKQNCLDKLLGNFVLNEDFTETSVNSAQQGGRPKHKYYLTVECFKSMGMMAGTEKGKLIRKYFLECEKIAKQQGNMSEAELLLKAAQELVQVRRQQAQQQKSIDLHEYHIRELNRDIDYLERRCNRADAEIFRVANPNNEYFTVAGYFRLIGWKVSPQHINHVGKKCSQYCKRNDIPKSKVYDVRFGTVGCYPKWVIELFRCDGESPIITNPSLVN